jgi:glycosyltransferase involved in cell wall biosynthesis/SAM-dependent methyltransferase
MRVSMLNLNLIEKDAIGACIIHMARFFRDRGDEVKIYIEHPPEGVSADIASLCQVVSLGELISGRQSHFVNSDLFIYHYPIRYDLLESIKGIERGAVIFYYHGVTPLELWGYEEDRDLLVRGVEGVSLVHYADLAIACSEFTKEELVQRYGYDADRVRIIPLPMTQGDFRPGTKDPDLVARYGLEGRRVLLYVGRMAGNKRIDLLVRALVLVRAQVPEAILLLVGDNNSAVAYRGETEKARALAAELDISGSVIFTGRVDRLPDYYRLAEVYLSASLHEGFGLPLLEAMSSGVPIVAARAGAIPQVVGQAGLLCMPGDAADLAAKALSVLQDTTLHSDLVRKGLERAQEFTLERYQRELKEGCEDALSYAHLTPGRRLRPTHAKTLATEVATPPSPPMPTRPSGPTSAAEHPLSFSWPVPTANPDIMIRGYVVRSDKPIIGPLIAWIRRHSTSHLREPYLDPMLERQVIFNYQVVQAWQELIAQLRDLVGRWQRIEQKVVDLDARLTAWESQWQRTEEHLSFLETLHANLDGRQTTLFQVQTQTAQNVAGLQAMFNSDPVIVRERLQAIQATLDQAPAEVWHRLDRLWQLLIRNEPEETNFSYQALGEKVGGAPEIVRNLYAPFADGFIGSGDVLDIGCGRGVFLKLLRERGVTARGVDLDSDMVAICRRAGLDAVQGDALGYLEGLPERSLGGIFCAHLIEHLPKSQLVRFTELAHSRLRSGAKAIFITPNGAGLTIYHATFYKDLTHQQPLHPEAIRFLLEASGFHGVTISTLSATPAEQKLSLLPTTALPANLQPLVEAINANLEQLNALLYGDLDCAVTGLA